MNDSIPEVQEEASEAELQNAFAVDFPTATSATSNAKLPLNRFYDVNVTVSVELGRVEMPIGEMLQLGDGAVVELTRNVSEEVDIMAQGVRIAKGEVVVVDDRFAVRITNIEDEEKTG
ncbi:MAG: flagellar motor switch protein FliN [Planctomicrobium sp.]|jgi:flagellar motor switch protein FliN|nr:flagellar motor switch protein FliN [Planctomicrobium sp.]